MMVFVWMFALMTSFANACILGGGAPAKSFGHPHIAAGGSDVGIVGVGSHHDHEHGATKAACKSFCDREQGTILKSDASLGPDIDSAPLPQADPWPAPSTRAATSVSIAACREPPPGPPVTIRFPRLTI